MGAWDRARAGARFQWASRLATGWLGSPDRGSVTPWPWQGRAPTWLPPQPNRRLGRSVRRRRRSRDPQPAGALTAPKPTSSKATLTSWGSQGRIWALGPRHGAGLRQAGSIPWLSDQWWGDRCRDGWSLRRRRTCTHRDTSLRTHQPEPPALGHPHGHSELAVGHVQEGLALAQHQGTAAVAVWAEAGVGVACSSRKTSASPTRRAPGPAASSWLLLAPGRTGPSHGARQLLSRAQVPGRGRVGTGTREHVCCRPASRGEPSLARVCDEQALIHGPDVRSRVGRAQEVGHGKGHGGTSFDD